MVHGSWLTAQSIHMPACVPSLLLYVRLAVAQIVTATTHQRAEKVATQPHILATVPTEATKWSPGRPPSLTETQSHQAHYAAALLIRRRHGKGTN